MCISKRKAIRGRQARHFRTRGLNVCPRVRGTETHPQLTLAPCKDLDPQVPAPGDAISVPGGPLQASAGSAPQRS